MLIATAAKASPLGHRHRRNTQRMAIEADTTFGQPRDDAGMKGLAAARHRPAELPRARRLQLTQQDREERPPCTGRTLPAIPGRKNLPPLQRLPLLRDPRRLRHDGGPRAGRTEQAPAASRPRTLVVGITTDIIFTPAEMRSLHAMIPGSAYHESTRLPSHDGFLVEHEQLNDILLPFMNN